MTQEEELKKRIAGAAQGDQEAVGELLERYLPDLHAYVRLRAGGMLLARESSADLVQSICREALGEIDGFEFRGEGPFRSWLYTLAQRKIAGRYTYHRAQKREVGREVPISGPARRGSEPIDIQLADSYAALFSPSRQVAADEFIVKMEQVFDKLPEDYREVILLSRSAGLSRDEIAERMGRTTGSVRMLLSRALAELARHLDDGGTD